MRRLPAEAGVSLFLGASRGLVPFLVPLATLRGHPPGRLAPSYV